MKIKVKRGYIPVKMGVIRVLIKYVHKRKVLDLGCVAAT